MTIPDLFNPGPVARSKDRPTSWEAAKRAARRQTETQTIILSLLRSRGPMTDPEIRQAVDAIGFPVSDSGLRTRRKELVDSLDVEKAGERDGFSVWRVKADRG